MPERLFAIFSFVIQLAIVAGVVAAIVVLVRRRGGAGDDQGIGTLRRLFLYGLSLPGLGIAATGVVLLISAILETLFGPGVISIRDTPLALGLALTIVGTPIWLLFWMMAQRSVRQVATETGGATRKLYLYLVLGASGITMAVGAIMFLAWLFGAGDFSGAPAAVVVVGSAVWVFHWRVESREGQPTELAASIRRVYVYGLALFGLVLLALGTGGILRMTLGAAYEALFGAPDLLTGDFGTWNEATQASLAMALVGGAVWWWHWRRVAKGDVESGSRHVYLYLFGILGGAVTVVSSLSVLLFHILQWFVGSPGDTSALLHFDVVPVLVAAVTVGGGLWGYHWAAVQQEAPFAQRGLVAARRVYSYLVSAVGLATLGAGLVSLFAVAIGLLSPGEGLEITGSDWWRNPVVLAVTLLVVGSPVWGLYWRDVQGLAVQGGPEERAALSRRVFIYLIFGISVLLTLINLSIVLFRLFDAALGEGAAWDVLWKVRWSVGILLTAGAMSVYYWLVLREDRKAIGGFEPVAEPMMAQPPEARPRRFVTAVVAQKDLPLVRRLEARLGYGMQVWQRTESQGLAPAVSDDYLRETEQRIVDADSDHVLLLVDTEGIHVVPYRGR